MKRQVIDLIIILILITIIYIKDMFGYRNSQIKIIETSLNNDLALKLDDYEKLLKEINIPKMVGFKCITKIKSYKINEFYDHLMIYNNKNCNLKKNDIVLGENGIIGFLSKVNNNRADVKLITSSDTSLSIKINNNYGELYAKNGKLYASNFINPNTIQINDKVYTSGLTDIPKNLLLGTVSKISDNKNKMIIEINPTSNIIKSPYVSVYGVEKW